ENLRNHLENCARFVSENEADRRRFTLPFQSLPQPTQVAQLAGKRAFAPDFWCELSDCSTSVETSAADNRQLSRAGSVAIGAKIDDSLKNRSFDEKGGERMLMGRFSRSPP